MADTSRQIQGGVQPFVVGDKSFRGIDTYTDPNKLENGFAETIDGLIVDGGSLVLRNGFHGQLPYGYIQTPSTSAGIYEMTPIKGQGTNAGHFIFTQGGELYAFNTSTNTQVALSTNFSATYGMYSPNVRLTVFGKYIYGVPGLKADGSLSSMPMFRVNTAQFMPISSLSNSSGDLLVTLASPFNTYFVENGSPIRIRLVTGSLPATVSPTVTYYVRDFTMGASTSTFKLSATLTGARVAYAAATGTYQLVWMAEVLPTITSLTSLSPSTRPYVNAQWSMPPTQQQYFIDESVGPNLISETGGGSTNLIINGTFTAFASNAAMSGAPTGTTGWGPIGSANVYVYDNTKTPLKQWFLSNATNTLNPSATGSSSYKMIQIDGAVDAVYQDIPTSGGTPRIPREQVNYVDQRQSGNLFEGVIGGVNTTVTFSGTTVSGTFTGTAVFPQYSAVQFTTTGTLPGGLSTNTTYYVLNTISTTGVQIGLTYNASSYVSFTGTGTGVHTMVASGVTTFSPHALTVGQRILTGTPPSGTPTSGLSASAVEAFVLSTPDNHNFTLSTVSPTGTVYTSTQGGYVAYKTIQTCGQYVYSLWAMNLDSQNSKTGQSILVTIQGSDIDGNAIAGAFVSQVIAPPIAKANSDWVKYSIVVDFRVYAATLGSMRITIQNINAVQDNDKGIYVTNVECYAISPRLGVNTADYIDKTSGLLKVKAIQNNTSIKGYAGRLKGCSIKIDLGAQCILQMTNGSNLITPLKLDGTANATTFRQYSQVRLLTTTTMPTNFSVGTTYFIDGFTGPSTIALKNHERPFSSTFVSCGSVPTGIQYGLIQNKNDWSKYDTISVRMVFPEKLQANIPKIRLGIQESNYLSTSYNIIEWGGFGQYDIDNGYMTWSIRGFGKTNLDSITQIYLRFENDIDNIQSYDDICWIGDVGVNGNLTAGSKYAYRYTLWYPKDGATPPFTPATGTGTSSTYYLGYESDPTKVTGELTATEALSSNQITLNPNGETITTQGHTHFIIYRRSTSFPDGLYRCIGSVPIGMNTTYGANLSIKATTDGKYVLIDNVPEMDVLDDGPKGSQGDVYEIGQDLFPTGATTCVVHQSRLWVGNKNTVWVSWFHDIDNEYTIRTTHVPLPTDPKIAIKGASFDVASPYDSEYITGFLPYHGDMMSRNNSTSAVMLVFRENTVYPVTGFDPSNWNIQGFLAEPGIGCIAKRAMGTVLGQPWWVNNTGVVQFAGTKVIPVAIQLDGLYAYKPYKVSASVYNATNTSISLADYRNSLMVMHDKRVWLFGPSATYGSFTGQAGIRTAYVFDTRIQAWSTVSFGNSVDGDVTGGCSIQTSTDVESLYIGCSNGQIYRYYDYYDSRFELTVSSINMGVKPNRVNISSLDWTALSQYGGTSTIIITSSSNATSGFSVGNTYRMQLSVSGGNYFTLLESSTSTITLNAGGTTVTAVSPASAPADGTVVTLTGITGTTGTGLANNVTLYVVNSSGTTFGLSATFGGTAITFGGTSSTPTMYTYVTFTDAGVFSFRVVETINWLYNSRLYGQTYSEGISYYSKNRPHQLDVHIDTDSGGSVVNWTIFGAGGTRDFNNSQVDSNSTMIASHYLFKNNTARAIRGIPTYMNDINWQIILNGSDAFYPFRIYGAHLHMVESGITRHR